jgi:hypothetical protein
LSDLIREYNKHVARELAIDFSVVDLRHALVHGRVSSPTPESPPSLLKFSKPAKGDAHVSVECNYSLTSDWMKEQNKRLFEELKKVARAKPHIFSGV